MDNYLLKNNYFSKVSRKEYNFIKQSNHFDEVYYRTKYGVDDCVKHYITIGWRMGYNPSKNFSTNDYLELNPDIIALDVCPLLHYEMIGRKKWYRYTKNKVIDKNKIEQYWRERKRYPVRDKVQYSCMTGGYDDFVISDYFNVTTASTASNSLPFLIISSNLTNSSCISTSSSIGADSVLM